MHNTPTPASDHQPRGNVYTDPGRGVILKELQGHLAHAPYLRSFSRRLLDRGVSINDKTLRHIAQGRIVQVDSRDDSRYWILSEAKALDVLAAVRLLCAEDANVDHPEAASDAEPQLLPYDPDHEAALRDLQALLLRLSRRTTISAIAQHLAPGKRGPVATVSALMRGSFIKPMGNKAAGRMSYVMSEQAARNWIIRLGDMPEEPAEARRNAPGKVAAIQFLADLIAPFYEEGQGVQLRARMAELGYAPSTAHMSNVLNRDPWDLYIGDQGLANHIAGVIAAKRTLADRPFTPGKGSRAAALRAWQNRRKSG